MQQVRQHWHTSTALVWLQSVLQERFGHSFTLEMHDNQILSVALEGDDRAITLALASDMFTRADSELPCVQWNAVVEGWSTAVEHKLPAPGASQLPVPLMEFFAHGCHIHYDVLGMIYWMLTRQEEVGRTDLDEHGRFPAAASHAYKHGYLERPIVDEWLHVLSQVIQRVWPQLELKRHRFNMKVSHDVDSPSLYGFKPWWRVARAMAGDLLKRHDLRAFVMVPVLAPVVKLGSRRTLHPADPFNTFDWLMDQSEANGLQSAFYFICGRSDERYDADYEPEHPAIRHLMKHIHARGHEIGLHPSYGSYQKPNIIAAEAQRLRLIAQELGISQPQWGGRMHYLRWEQPTTLRAWADAGMDYDSTLGYADHPGFRCGTCFEYPAFDPVAGAELPLRVRPLIAMEVSVIDPAYLGLGIGLAAQAKFDQLRTACAHVGGCFTLLWHNSSVINVGLKEMYSRVTQIHY